MTDKTEKKGRSAEEKQKNRALVIICIAAVIIIIALVIVIIMMMSRGPGHYGEGGSQGNEPDERRRPVLITEDNIEEIANQTEQPEEVPMRYRVTMNSTWEFEDGKSESENAYVENSESNETPVYFDVVRNDTGETIYQSPVIPVGEHLDSVTLDEELEAGSYECTLTYHLIDDDQNTLTTVNMWLMVEIKN